VRQRRGHDLALWLEVTQDNVLLGGDVAEQRPAADPDFLRDLRRRRLIESLLEEQPHAGLHDLLADGLSGLLPIALSRVHRRSMSSTEQLTDSADLT
jgi:hypothetical protein